MSTENHFQCWLEARTRFAGLLPLLTEEILKKKPAGSANSAAFLIRHIADVEFLFAKNVFGGTEIKAHATTLIAGSDTGNWGNLQELTDYQYTAFLALKDRILVQKNEDWDQTIVTKEFGEKTKAQAIGRIISHTAYHAGQLAVCIKYGV